MKHIIMCVLLQKHGATGHSMLSWWFLFFFQAGIEINLKIVFAREALTKLLYLVK